MAKQTLRMLFFNGKTSPTLLHLYSEHSQFVHTEIEDAAEDKNMSSVICWVVCPIVTLISLIFYLLFSNTFTLVFFLGVALLSLIFFILYSRAFGVKNPQDPYDLFLAHCAELSHALGGQKTGFLSKQKLREAAQETIVGDLVLLAQAIREQDLCEEQKIAEEFLEKHYAIFAKFGLVNKQTDHTRLEVLAQQRLQEERRAA